MMALCSTSIGSSTKGSKKRLTIGCAATHTTHPTSLSTCHRTVSPGQWLSDACRTDPVKERVSDPIASRHSIRRDSTDNTHTTTHHTRQHTTQDRRECILEYVCMYVYVCVSDLAFALAACTTRLSPHDRGFSLSHNTTRSGPVLVRWGEVMVCWYMCVMCVCVSDLSGVMRDARLARFRPKRRTPATGPRTTTHQHTRQDKTRHDRVSPLAMEGALLPMISSVCVPSMAVVWAPGICTDSCCFVLLSLHPHKTQSHEAMRHRTREECRCVFWSGYLR